MKREVKSTAEDIRYKQKNKIDTNRGGINLRKKGNLKTESERERDRDIPGRGN